MTVTGDTTVGGSTMQDTLSGLISEDSRSVLLFSSSPVTVDVVATSFEFVLPSVTMVTDDASLTQSFASVMPSRFVDSLTHSPFASFGLLSSTALEVNSFSDTLIETTSSIPTESDLTRIPDTSVSVKSAVFSSSTVPSVASQQPETGVVFSDQSTTSTLSVPAASITAATATSAPSLSDIQPSATTLKTFVSTGDLSLSTTSLLGTSAEAVTVTYGVQSVLSEFGASIETFSSLKPSSLPDSYVTGPVTGSSSVFSSTIPLTIISTTTITTTMASSTSGATFTVSVVTPVTAVPTTTETTVTTVAPSAPVTTLTASVVTPVTAVPTATETTVTTVVPSAPVTTLTATVATPVSVVSSVTSEMVPSASVTTLTATRDTLTTSGVLQPSAPSLAATSSFASTVSTSETVTVLPSSVIRLSESSFISSDTGSTSSDTGLASTDTGSTLSDTGSTLSDTGSTSSDTGSKSSDTGAATSDTGSASSGTGLTSSDTGSTLSDTGSASSDTGSTLSDTGSPSSDTGFSTSDTSTSIDVKPSNTTTYVVVSESFVLMSDSLTTTFGDTLQISSSTLVPSSSASETASAASMIPTGTFVSDVAPTSVIGKSLSTLTLTPPIMSSDLSFTTIAMETVLSSASGKLPSVSEKVTSLPLPSDSVLPIGSSLPSSTQLPSDGVLPSDSVLPSSSIDMPDVTHTNFASLVDLSFTVSQPSFSTLTGDMSTSTVPVTISQSVTPSSAATSTMISTARTAPETVSSTSTTMVTVTMPTTGTTGSAQPTTTEAVKITTTTTVPLETTTDKLTTAVSSSKEPLTTTFTATSTESATGTVPERESRATTSSETMPTTGLTTPTDSVTTPPTTVTMPTTSVATPTSRLTTPTTGVTMPTTGVTTPTTDVTMPTTIGTTPTSTVTTPTSETTSKKESTPPSTTITQSATQETTTASDFTGFTTAEYSFSTTSATGGITTTPESFSHSTAKSTVQQSTTTQSITTTTAQTMADSTTSNATTATAAATTATTTTTTTASTAPQTSTEFTGAQTTVGQITPESTSAQTTPESTSAESTTTQTTPKPVDEQTTSDITTTRESSVTQRTSESTSAQSTSESTTPQSTSESTSPQSTSLPTTEQTTPEVSTVAPSRGCNAEPCLNGATCVNVTQNGVLDYMCMCTFKYEGKRCETEKSYSSSQYDSTGYLMYPPPQLQQSNTITLEFNTTQANGTLFYSDADYNADWTHYIYLYVENGVLKYQFSCKLERFTLNSGQVVNTGEIFNVTVIQTQDCFASLDVRGPAASPPRVELGMSFVFPSFRLTTLSNLYLGGLPSSVQPDNQVAPLASYVGCLGSMMVNGESYEYLDAVEGVNVYECGYVPPITTSPAPVTTVTPSPRPPTCADITCNHGGTCREVLTSGGGLVCDCALGFSGPRCKKEVVVYFPSFGGNSYLEHAAINVSMATSDLFLTFKTSHTSGTILFSQSQVSGSFMHLYVEGGYIKYQFACNHGNILMIDTQVYVATGNLTAVNLRHQHPWMTDVNTVRQRCSAAVQVDSYPEIISSQLVLATYGTYGPLYLGGYATGIYSPDARATPFLPFVGCIRNLQVNDREVDVFFDALRGQNIADCTVPPCSYEPCRNNATCQLDGESWFCDCLSDYTGVLCERRLCQHNPCQHGGTCIILQGQGQYVCLCPYGRRGVHCTEAAVISRPAFFGDQYGYSSYLAYPKIPSLEFEMDIRFKFTLNNLDTALDSGLMIFTGQQGNYPNGSDYLAVGMEGGHVVYMFDLGTGPRKLVSPEPVDTSATYHIVELGRSYSQGHLKVDNQVKVTGSSLGKLIGLNSFSEFYVGGYDVFEMKLLPLGVNFTVGFQGCIFDLEVRGGSSGQFQAPGLPPGHVTSGRNVQQCNASECAVNTCQNGGTCVDLGASFRCHCSSGWKGALCSEQISVCDTSSDCANGSTCVPLTEGGYRCDCPLGKAGERCEQSITISDPIFIGEASYMAFEPVHIGRSCDIRIQVNPRKQDGVLFYAAEHMNERSGDFIALSLNNGSVDLRLNLGTSPTAVLTSSTMVTPGVWSVIEVRRNGSHATLSVDGEVVTGTTTPGTVSLDTRSFFYLGGLPQLSMLNPSAVENDPVTYEGCIREFIVNGRTYDLTVEGAVSGLNVGDCDGTGCGYSVCQNGGTCNAAGDSYQCSCPQLYFGNRCEQSIYCRDHSCENGASCVPQEASATYTCSCPLGWSGQFCSQDYYPPRYTCVVFCVHAEFILVPGTAFPGLSLFFCLGNSVGFIGFGTRMNI
ncbi:protein eyes shut-like [Lingula anatina]|uniref:Protein eyes shut-like n=1 Tax=Lingula anatina TaxID=7574 RepID=A0A2R2MRD8_LINAN|nr:protein eyes shut-like [Lingula anatina]|eukprot:XP_023932811.1 protein eyes shut-like [Lingula anatina]